mmetsp:Transcript_24212/g.56809  ORF Transcript_24212/g.56809 Transcript_24212/m.56809 type:complete len:214 (+) Transcript_24212:246-887(+)
MLRIWPTMSEAEEPASRAATAAAQMVASFASRRCQSGILQALPREGFPPRRRGDEALHLAQGRLQRQDCQPLRPLDVRHVAPHRSHLGRSHVRPQRGLRGRHRQPVPQQVGPQPGHLRRHRQGLGPGLARPHHVDADTERRRRPAARGTGRLPLRGQPRQLAGHPGPLHGARPGVQVHCQGRAGQGPLHRTAIDGGKAYHDQSRGSEEPISNF